MPIVQGYINVYVSGFWHQEGKAGAFNRHGGDIYPSAKAAFDAIEQPHMHVATVPLYWEENKPVRANVDPRPLEDAMRECIDRGREVCWLRGA